MGAVRVRGGWREMRVENIRLVGRRTGLSCPVCWAEGRCGAWLDKLGIEI